MVVSNGLRRTLIWSKFQNLPGGACPQTPLQCCVLYDHTQLCATGAALTPSLCMPAPSSISGSAPAIVGLIEEVFPMNDHSVFLAAIVLTQLNGLSCHMSHYLAPATSLLLYWSYVLNYSYHISRCTYAASLKLPGLETNH